MAVNSPRLRALVTILVAATVARAQAPERRTLDLYQLKTTAENGKLLFIGIGGDIDGIINPDLVIPRGAVVRIVLINGESYAARSIPP